jgi:hypothetical protein
MKTMERKIFALVGAMACSFSFGLAQHQAGAIPLPTCENSCCEPLYAWVITDGSITLSAQVAGTTNPLLPANQTTTAIPFVNLPAETPGGCALKAKGTFDAWKWKTWNFSCQDNSGGNPTPQQVTPTDTTPTMGTPGLTRNICVVSSGGSP